MARAQNGKPNENLDLGMKKSGLLLVVQKLEKNGIITVEDADIFLDDLDLPEITEEQIIKECLDAGGSQFGFVTLETFFIFVVRHLRDVTPKVGVSKHEGQITWKKLTKIF